MTVRTLKLYKRPDCHLCDDMCAALEPWRERLGFVIERIDVDGVPALEARFGAKVPVLVEDDQEICHYFLDEPALLRRFAPRGHA